MRPDQLDTLVTLSAPTLRPDGAVAVVAATRPSFAADAYVGQLWRFETTGGAPPRRITRGRLDTAPQFSPEGATLAFLRSVEGTPQLAVVEADGGEPRILTDAPLGVAGFVWSADSRRIAFTAAMPEHGRYGTLAGVKPGQESPRRVTGNQWRQNGRGFSKDKPVGVYVLEVPGDDVPWIEPVGRMAASSAGEDPSGHLAGRAAKGEDVPCHSARSGAESQNLGSGSSRDGGVSGSCDCARDDEVRGGGGLGAADRHRTLGGAKGLPEARLLTPPATDAANPVFSPDGEWLYFTAALNETADDDVRTTLYRVPVAGGQDPELVAPTSGTQAILAAAFAGDTMLAATQDLGETGLDFVAKLVGICAIDAAGETRLLTDPDTEDFGGHDSFIARGGNDSILVPRCDRGGNALVRFDSSGQHTEVLPRGERVITGAAEKSGTLAVTYSDPTTPGELAVVRDGELITLSDFVRTLPTPVAQREITVTGPDGYPVHGWVFLPDGDGPHPVLLNIHGGPFADYTWGYFDEPQVLAEAGYAVVQCNPRGSQGYGRAHGLAVKERMGTVDMQDVLAFLDGAIAEFDELDGERVGILGGSYGGYLTAWTIAHEHRFAAAIVERGYLDPLAFIGTSDIGWFFSEEYVGRDPGHALTQSPQAVVHQVRTPTLVMHSEEDWRCPPDQAQRYFASLRRAGVETEMLLFPGENHELSRSGTPWHRRERFEAILEWWGRYLPVHAG